jgi:chromosome segregation ATPase
MEVKMDINQAAKMIEWLDEERRRDKTTISTLEERLAQQQMMIENMQRRLTGVESDQNVSKAQTTLAVREQELIEQLRKEMRQIVENSEARRLNAEREAERRAGVEREHLTRPVHELSQKLTEIERATTDVPALQQEHDRLFQSINHLQQRIDDLNKKIDEPERRLAFLEEQRRQDVRRLSEVETDLPEIRKQIDSIRPKLTLLEDLSLRNERRAQEVQNSDHQRREQIQEFIDQQTLIMQQRDSQINELLTRFGKQDSLMQQNIDRFETWEEAYRQMRGIIEDFQRISDRLERRINEVAEMQRLSEERFRQEWNDWRTDDQKRWKQFTLSNDEVWRLHDKDFERFVERIDQFSNQITPLRDHIDRLWKLERERARLYRERYQELVNEYDSKQSPLNGDGLNTTSIRDTGTNPTINDLTSNPTIP